MSKLWIKSKKCAKYRQIDIYHKPIYRHCIGTYKTIIMQSVSNRHKFIKKRGVRPKASVKKERRKDIFYIFACVTPL